jgi:hypothetical protein
MLVGRGGLTSDGKNKWPPLLKELALWSFQPELNHWFPSQLRDKAVVLWLWF